MLVQWFYLSWKIQVWSSLCIDLSLGYQFLHSWSISDPELVVVWQYHCTLSVGRTNECEAGGWLNSFFFFLVYFFWRSRINCTYFFSFFFFLISWVGFIIRNSTLQFCGAFISQSPQLQRRWRFTVIGRKAIDTAKEKFKR